MNIDRTAIIDPDFASSSCQHGSAPPRSIRSRLRRHPYIRRSPEDPEDRILARASAVRQDDTDRVSSGCKLILQNTLAGQLRFTCSSFDRGLNPGFTEGMCWIPLLLAGTSLMALPHPRIAAEHTTPRAPTTVSAFAQTSSPEGNLPTARYVELRTQTLAHARLIAGPRLKNPGVANGGLDRSVFVILAEERTNRLNRAGLPSPTAGNTALLADHPATLLPSTSNQSTQHVNGPVLRDAPPKRSACSWPVIHAINGRTVSPVFTPAQPDNHYRISGCAFGSAPGTVRLQPAPGNPLLGATPAGITLELDSLGSWADDHIDVHIDPGLTGIPDFPADLVIQFPNGHSVQMPRCQFLAARGEPQLLRAIPAAWVRLDATSLSARAIRQVEFESPPVTGEEIPPDAVGSSAFISRSDPQAFATGKDTYDLSQLAPGWVVDSVQLRVFDAVCPGENKLAASNGSWRTTWTSHGFVVAWADETCASPIPPVFNFTLSSSQYATNIWVIGPAGTQPISNTFTARQP